MAETVVEICNMALVRLGVGTLIINLITDDSKPAELCRLFYDNVRDEVLRDHPWTCATTWASLAQLEETPINGYSYAYALPTSPKCLRVLNASDEDIDYRIESGKLYTDEEEITIRYIARVTDPTLFDSYLVDAIALRLASELAYALPNKQSMRQDLLAEYVAALRRARGRDAQESRQDGIDEAALWEDERE